MKTNNNLFVTLIFCSLIGLSEPVVAQLSEAERMERCQNNKNRIAELETELQSINTDLSAAMTKKEIEDTRTQMVFIKSNRTHKTKTDRIRFDQISNLHKFNFRKCFDEIKESTDRPHDACVDKLHKIIAAKIDRALSLNRPALLAKKSEIDQQIAAHRSRLITLNCDNQNKSTSNCKAQGTWTQDTPGIGSTDWTIKSDGTAEERGIGYAKGKATFKDNKLRIDWQTHTGYSGYYEWTLNEDCSSGKGDLVFKTGRTDQFKSTVKKK